MRCRRLLAQGQVAHYHVISRIVGGQRVLNPVAREVLRRMLRKVEGFTGVQVLTYAIMENHLHLLVEVPPKPAHPPTDAELVARFRLLHPGSARWSGLTAAGLASLLSQGGEPAQRLRQALLAQFWHLPSFMKLLKQRFTIWFNRNHDRFGTLWAERYSSTLIEADRRALLAVAAYIDLNAVRAGLVADAKDFRFCGYAEALAGARAAREGLRRLHAAAQHQSAQSPSARAALQRHRLLLLQVGHAFKSSSGQRVSEPRELPLAGALLHRIRYFAQGLALGSNLFIQGWLERWHPALARRRKFRPVDLGSDLAGLAVLRGPARPSSRMRTSISTATPPIGR